jgi:hypothetical protein
MARQGITHLDKSMRFEYFFNDLHQTGRRWAAGDSRIGVQSHGGVLSVEPNEPNGTVFVIRLPKAR